MTEQGPGDGRAACIHAALPHARGGPEPLFYKETTVPDPGPDDVLVEVHAAGVTRAELSCKPKYTDPDETTRLPSIPSHEVAGVVVEWGREARGLTADEAVSGIPPLRRNGAAAVYVVLPASSVAPKPAGATELAFAAVTLSGLTAWQAHFERGKLRAGQRVLVLGAAGGVTSFAVQLGHAAGAHVARPGEADFVGANRVSQGDHAGGRNERDLGEARPGAPLAAST